MNLSIQIQRMGGEGSGFSDTMSGRSNMTTVDIPDEIIQKAMQVGGAQSARDVVIKALEEFARRHDQAELIQYLGTSDGFMTPEELDEMRKAD